MSNNKDDYSDLFIKTCKILKDNLITELKDQNTFLKKLLYKNNDLLKGKKVKIIAHQMFNDYIEESEGIFLKLSSFSSAIVLIKKDNKRIIKYINTEYLEFDESEFIE